MTSRYPRLFGYIEQHAAASAEFFLKQPGSRVFTFTLQGIAAHQLCHVAGFMR